MKLGFLQFIAAYLKIGLMGFGGGSALIPVVEKETVEKKAITSPEKFSSNVIIANITPGALPVKLAALSKDTFSTAAPFAIALPGVAMTLLILWSFSIIGQGGVHYIEYASVGISCFIILLLFHYISKVFQSGGLPFRTAVAIMLGTFFLTSGKEVHNFLDLQGLYWEATSPFNLSTIDIMILTFFIIFLWGKSPSKQRYLVGFIIGLLYALQKGDCVLVGIPSFLLYVLMIACPLITMNYDRSFKNISACMKLPKHAVIACIIFIAVPSIFIMLSILMNGMESISYCKNVAVSTLTSFGGGEAYISVADSFFVEQNYISAKDYYGKVVSVANALPGPILVKVASGVGYFFGYAKSGVLGGMIAALAGFSISVSTSSLGAILVAEFFVKMSDSPRIKMVCKCILPVVCGLLITTILTMLSESLKIVTIGTGLNPVVGFSLVILLTGVIANVKHKLNNDIATLLIGGGVSLLMLSMF